jgi:hypothetical protein
MNDQPANHNSSDEPLDRRQARRQRRYERLAARGDFGREGSWIVGLVLILLGGAFLLNNMGLLALPLTNWWALFILLPAIGALQRGWHMVQGAGNRLTAPASGSLLVGVVLLLVTAAFLLNLDWTLFGPVLLILAGIGTLLAAFATSR